MKVWRVTLKLHGEYRGTYYENNPQNIIDKIKDMEPEPRDNNYSCYTIRAYEMTEEEYDKLPEFMGF